MILNKFGEIAKNIWMEIPKHFKNVGLDEFIVMPNHVHGILIIEGTHICVPYRIEQRCYYLE